MEAGERIRETRQALKMTVTGLARASGLTKGFISQVEGGKSNPSLTSLARIASALQVPLSSLLVADATGREASALSRTPAIVASRNSYETAGLVVLSGVETGTHHLATIPLGYELGCRFSASRAATGNALAIVLQGSIEIVQGDTRLAVARDEVASFDPGLPYSLSNTGVTSALLFVFVPSGCAVPLLSRSIVRAAGTRNRPDYSSAVQGPMRLAAMRAERQKMGER